ncbi:hypothetical protein P171DRAFT_520501 [Karstenula rhodostoma CBS 690.94]|uniref:CFEM domain-containing protein n=1 Tax=Karstenula rhodostoma CBS 690.94 TaxID=1392251 RepID=A0A9P4PMA4_9PLEO|nr:hypothetical protein P171DRAFT_520501 [Karstenula rhodostoma CBS 690.94]
MRWTSIMGLVLAIFSFTIRPVLGQLPDCAQTCFESAVANQTECARENMPCICASPAINAAIQGCVGASCTIRQALVAVNTTQTMCGAPVRDKTSKLLWVSIVSGALALLAIIMRSTVAFFSEHWRWDDVCALAAWFFSIPLTVLQLITPGLGLGKDTWTVETWKIIRVLQMIYASQAGYFITIGFTKLTFLFFFLYIFPTTGVRTTVFILMGITVLHSLGFELALIFSCLPIKAVWTGWMREEPFDYCMNQNAFIYAAAGTNIAIDLGILAVPIPQLLKLKLSLRRKFFLICIFSVGFLTMIVSCIRIQTIATYGNSNNPMYDSLEAALYSVLEQNVGIICICMPMFRRFFGHMFPRCFGSSQDDSNFKYDDGTPNARISSGKRSTPKNKRSTLNGSLFETQITKTVDTRVTSTQLDDEVRLVELQDNGKHPAPSV